MRFMCEIKNIFELQNKLLFFTDSLIQWGVNIGALDYIERMFTRMYTAPKHNKVIALNIDTFHVYSFAINLKE